MTQNGKKGSETSKPILERKDVGKQKAKKEKRRTNYVAGKKTKKSKPPPLKICERKRRSVEKKRVTPTRRRIV